MNWLDAYLTLGFIIATFATVLACVQMTRVIVHIATVSYDRLGK